MRFCGKSPPNSVIAPTHDEIVRFGGNHRPHPEIPHQEHYKIFRDYLQHEDDLINNRLNWNFTIQGFLFASYSFTLQKISEVKSNLLFQIKPLASVDIQKNGTLINDLLNSHTAGLRELRVVLIVLALVGFAVSLLVFLSVSAARIAVEELESKWLELNPEYRPDAVHGHKKNTHGQWLPGIIGGGRIEAHGLGFYAPTALPIIFVAAWVLLLCFMPY